MIPFALCKRLVEEKTSKKMGKDCAEIINKKIEDLLKIEVNKAESKADLEGRKVLKAKDFE